MSSYDTRDDAHKSADRLEREIDETRADIGDTVDALARRFSPGEILDQSLAMIRQHGGEFAGNFGDSVKQKPLALLLTGVGLAWLMSPGNGRAEYRTHRAGSSLSNAGKSLSQTGDEIKGALAGARDRLSGARDSLSETVSQTADSTRHRAAAARQGVEHWLQEEPLILGALGLALGAIAGAALPRTDAEDRFIGSASDATKNEIQGQGRRLYDEAKEKAEEVAGNGRSAEERAQRPQH